MLGLQNQMCRVYGITQIPSYQSIVPKTPYKFLYNPTMSTANGLNLIFGAGGYGVYLASLGVDGHALAREQLNVLKETGIQSIDTSELYEGSEEELAHQQAPTHFRIHNKVKGGFARGRGRDAIIRAGQERLRLLETKQVSCPHSSRI